MADDGPGDHGAQEDAAQEDAGREDAGREGRADRLRGARAVSYDLWLTLIKDRDHDELWDRRARRLEPVLQTDGDGVGQAVRAAYRAHHDAWDAGRALPFRDLAAEVVRGAGLEVTDGRVDLVVAALDEPSLECGVDVLPGAAEALGRLHAVGVPVGLVCDTGFVSGAALRGVLAEAGLLRFLRVLVFSEEVGVPKPHADPFSALLHGLRDADGLADLEASQVVHVGDMRRKDAAGARAMGMGSIRYRGCRDDSDRDGHRPDADAVADSHAEVLELLGY